jgi:hypothetical protein
MERVFEKAWKENEGKGTGLAQLTGYEWQRSGEGDEIPRIARDGSRTRTRGKPSSVKVEELRNE